MTQIDNNMEYNTLKHIAFDTAWNLHVYGQYGEKEGRAVSAIRKRCPIFDRDQCLHALQEAAVFLESAKLFVAENHQKFFEHWNAEYGRPEHGVFDVQLHEMHPHIPIKTCQEAIARIHGWSYQR